jgi:hypothetical protein
MRGHRAQRWPLATWRVVVEAHRVERWNVPAHTVTVAAVSAQQAAEIVVRVLQCDAGLPPWRPFVRASLAHAAASPGRAAA